MNRIPSVSLRGDAAEAGAAPAPDPAALARWARAFCIIRFNLERGQLVEACFPPDALAHGGLDRLVAFSYFPDSMSHHLRRHRSSVHDSLFSFRVPDPSPPAAGSRRGFLYGFVFNRQRQDERLPRGGEQKSVVILSHAPYSSLFRLLLQIIGPLCFDIGHTALTMVASHVAAWPAPSTVVPHGAPHWQRRAAGAPSARDRRPWAAACAVAGEPLGAVSENYDTTGREFSTCVSWLQILLASDLGVRGGELRHHWKGVLLHETLKILLGHI